MSCDASEIPGAGKLSLPVCCRRSAFDAMRSLLGRIDEPAALLEGAAAIAGHPLPATSIHQIRGEIADMAQTIRLRVHGTQPQALLAQLHTYLFEEMGFVGNTDDYHNPGNTLLPEVLQNRTGLPITLSLVYKLVADALGLSCWGIGLPGHFIIAVQAEGRPLWIDAFSGGRVITVKEAQARMAGQFGSEIVWSARLMEPVDNRYWLTRILQNLLSAYNRADQYEDLAAILEMELLLWPDEARLQRDLALVLARAGHGEAACAWLEHYLENNPDDPQVADLKQLLASLA